eukprot:3885603-Pyramimonas_sp.AAC.1
MDGSPHIIAKDESPIAVGDVAFCRVQPTHQYYAHWCAPRRVGQLPPGEQALDRRPPSAPQLEAVQRPLP